MNLESNRLNTFANWPASAPVDPPRLARAGFFYTGEGTEAQCFSCNVKISQWNYGDQVMWRHRLMEPNCTFVEHPSLSGNISIESGAECDFPDTSSWPEVEGRQTESEDTTRDYGLTDEDEMYKSDALRLLSFVNWEDASVSREALVNAGFYHAGGGRLRCAWCGGELAPFTSLSSLGSPLEIHRMYFPRCDHAATIMAALQSSNISLPSSPLSDTPPIRSPVLNDNEPQSSGAAHNTRILNAGSTWRALGVVSGGARHPSHSSLSARLATFERWPTNRTQSPQALAEAGFYHTGTDDQVRCFYCDGGLGKWEAGDAPWSEHARWFPNCGYVLLVKGQEFVDSCKPKSAQRTVSNENGVALNRSNPTNNLPVTEEQICECLESIVGLGALAAGLDAARVRRAISRRLRTTGTPFTTSESLIDAVLDEQLNEEAWSVSTNSQRFARDILAETLRELVPRSRLIASADRSDSQASHSEHSTRTPSPNPLPRNPQTAGMSRSNTHHRSASRNRSSSQNRSAMESSTSRRSPSHSSSPSQSRTTAQNASQHTNGTQECEKRDSDSEKLLTKTADRKLSLEEENRQLKESRMCKVCMDSEVSVVFLPCGHLVSCARCGAALSACPLCRAAVRALVRAYLA